MSDMTLSDSGESLLKSVESLRLTPYDDQTGHDISSWVEGATVGYGHLIGRDEWPLYENGVTEAQAQTLFDDDLAPFLASVNRSVTVPLSPQQFDALVMLAFNIGIGGFETSSAVKLVNDPNASTPYDSLESAWKAWNKSQGKVNQGLVNRRDAEWKVYSQGVYERW